MKIQALTLLGLVFSTLLSGCGYLRIDPWHPLVRSDVIQTTDDEKRILAKARLEWSDDLRVRVLYVSGTPYERGFQQGALLRREVRDNLGYLYRRAASKFGFTELYDEAFERMRPYISEEYMDEMHGLAHGAGLPLRVVQGIHALPSLTEWGGKKHISNVIKQMMNGELATSCSNLCVKDGATADSGFYAVRILDWGLHKISKLHKYPLITVNVPDHGYASANIGWVGFLGAISGMNEQGITIGEMGYGNPPGETLAGKPMPFMLRDVLSQASNLAQVRSIISSSKGDCSYVYLMTDAKARKSEFYIRDKDRFIVYKEGDTIQDKENSITPIENTLYGGHYNDVMTKELTDNHGKITPELLMSEIIPKMVMPSNFQDVVYDPVHLRFWVAYARASDERAADQLYTFFDFGKGLEQFRSSLPAAAAKK